MLLTAKLLEDHSSKPIFSLRCPQCRQIGVFQAGTNKDTNIGQHILVGHRRCPDPNCYTHIFFAWQIAKDELLVTYPPERIDFDAADIPVGIVNTLEEAISCHAASCYRAAAIMVRRTLEELCHDRQATGRTLADRINALKSKVTLHDALFDGLTHLRWLGNDAAHIEMQTFDKIEEGEVRAALTVTKEILKAIYQQESLVKLLAQYKKKEDSST